MKHKLIFCLFLFTFFSQVSKSQVSNQAEIKSVVNTLFDGMRKGDSTIVKSVFHPSARLQIIYFKNGKSFLEIKSIKDFLNVVGKPHKEIHDEKLLSMEIKVENNLATIWAPYEFFLGTKFSHKGIDAFQLFKSDEGWKIISISYTKIENDKK